VVCDVAIVKGKPDAAVRADDERAGHLKGVLSFRRQFRFVPVFPRLGVPGPDLWRQEGLIDVGLPQSVGVISHALGIRETQDTGRASLGKSKCFLGVPCVTATSRRPDLSSSGLSWTNWSASLCTAVSQSAG